MASFDSVNYSLRPSKSIQRQLIFEGIRALGPSIDPDRRMVYIGLGSIWFADFVIAHKYLGIDDMVSIEDKEVGFRRALFNKPFSTVRVINGRSTEVLPRLFDDGKISGRPWFVWLDYDGPFGEDSKVDCRLIIEGAPASTIFILTFAGRPSSYGQLRDRPARFRTLFGDVVPNDLGIAECGEARICETLADFSLDFMKSMAIANARPGGFVPAFRIFYKDTAQMVTVGGILPSPDQERSATEVVRGPGWPCRPGRSIVAPHLTLREAAVLQSLLPRGEKLTRELVNQHGFDLEEDQIDAFETYYRQYPAFVQIVA